MINVYIVDDHELVMESLSEKINKSNNVRITGIFYDLKACREGLKRAKRIFDMPHVLLLDIELPDGDGVDFCAEVKKNYPDLKIIMLTHYVEFNIAKQALKKGALGYVVKNTSIKELLGGIESVANNKPFLCPKIERLLKKKEREGIRVINLTVREKIILIYTIKGFSMKGIAIIFTRVNTAKDTGIAITDSAAKIVFDAKGTDTTNDSCTEESVKGCRKNLHIKFGVKNVAALIWEATKIRVIPDDYDDFLCKHDYPV